VLSCLLDQEITQPYKVKPTRVSQAAPARSAKHHCAPVGLPENWETGCACCFSVTPPLVGVSRWGVYLPSRPTQSFMTRNSVNTDHHIPHIQLTMDRRATQHRLRAGGFRLRPEEKVLHLHHAE